MTKHREERDVSTMGEEGRGAKRRGWCAVPSSASGNRPIVAPPSPCFLVCTSAVLENLSSVLAARIPRANFPEFLTSRV